MEAKKAQKEAALQEKESKRALKEEAETPEREALDLIRAEEEKLAQLKREEQKKENERLALEYFARLDSDQVNVRNLEFIKSDFLVCLKAHLAPPREKLSELYRRASRLLPVLDILLLHLPLNCSKM